MDGAWFLEVTQHQLVSMLSCSVTSVFVIFFHQHYLVPAEILHNNIKTHLNYVIKSFFDGYVPSIMNIEPSRFVTGFRILPLQGSVDTLFILSYVHNTWNIT